ncbi:MAG: alpha/beta fold hydrolase [Burkholderiales bacterium]|nr:alpha/beta fold hydrolase [Burkholderiales bacterium]MDE1927588.1 alpha/beta fold hydrolase [Burkholderiales bacterium]MDE2158617.1 alpha/beta fold hydrolase [Burkholderiales bacterium]
MKTARHPPATGAAAKARPARKQAAPAAAGDLGALVAEASHHTLAINPLIGLSRGDVAGAAKSLLKAVAATPQRATRHYGRYLKELTQVVRGKSALRPDPKDRRFADPAWQNNALYARLMQSYLATQQELSRFIETSGLDQVEKGRAQFFAALVTDALAPSNWLLGNPAAVRKIVDTGGGHLVQGLKNLVHDMRHNHMLPSMVDATPFKVGANVATAAGQVVFRHEMFELLQYAPTTPEVHRRPLVISPPQVNKYYAMDLSPDKSLVKWTTDSGIQLFVVSWRNPTVEQRHWGLEDYVMALDAAVDVARRITGSPDVNMWGSCSGGMTLAAYLGWLAAQGDRKVAHTTWAVCVLDSEAAIEDSTLGLFNSPATIRAAKARSRRKGIVTGAEMATMFAWLRPNDLIWNYWVNNYLLGNSPPAYDVLAWNADTTRLPGRYHCDLLDLVEKNPYRNPGALEIGGLPIDMRQVELGAYVIAGITDHITPWRACYGTARLFGPGTTFVLANAGHLQSMINPPGLPKSYFFAAPASVEDPMQWAASAQAARQEGSWWPHWRAWIQGRSGDTVPAPARLGSRKHKPLGPAPGTYVLEP